MPHQTGQHDHTCCAMCCSVCNPPYSDMDGYDDDRPEYDREQVIQGHGYRPYDLTFYGRGPVYLGMELEVMAPSARIRDPWGDYSYNFDALEDMAHEVQSDLGPVCWLQEDGSIGYGFEITSHPMTYAWAMKHFPWEALERMADRGFSVNRSVGLHVHVSRAAFASECHLYRWMKFVYRNASQVQTLARRRNSEWASFDPHFRSQAKKYMKGPNRDETRYQAINPQNGETLEVRVFASSLRPREIQAALAFVASTVKYTRDLDASKIIKERGWAWSTYVEWLRAPDQEAYWPVREELEALACVS